MWKIVNRNGVPLQTLGIFSHTYHDQTVATFASKDAAARVIARMPTERRQRHQPTVAAVEKDDRV